MLDEFNPNDANSLNSAFYEELLYILGLCEVKESSKLLIKPSSQSANTLYNAILAKLSQDKQDFERVMSFVVLWLNRILFLKLIEANLVRFNDDESLKFLNPNKVRNFKALSQLFFEILAKKPKDRANSSLDYLPYLNSALFQKQAIEREILDIQALDDNATLPYFAKTQIKDKNAKKKVGSVPLLVYIFEFLDAFDFGSDEKSPELALQKELISSSVLGLVFEKLNGYKEGSFYTPSFITSYMCRASLEKVVLSKFNDKFKWQCEDLKALRERIDRDFSTKAQEFKAVLNSIRICDPAVGSGHFLVSALNEMIAIYHALGLAQRLNPCELALLSDELVITKPNGEIYAYKKPKIKNDESHAIQKALFTLKKQIIENNLFGVDINENSCEITKLRLWIELLKNSYYLQKDDEGFDENLNDEIHQMQTLPNIDINIKCGNSLISYFELNRSLTHYPNIKERMQKYKSVIKDYKEGFFDDKMRIEKEIKALKESFRTFCFKDKFNKEIKAFTAKCEAYSKKYSNFLAKDDENLSLYIAQSFSFFDLDESKARLEFNALKKEYESIFNLESKKPFEWRFEFPEVLNENGEFMGFDLVVGNPPYMQVPKNVYSAKTFPYSEGKDTGKQNTYKVFIEQGYNLAKDRSEIWLIVQTSLLCDIGSKYTRELLLDKTNINSFIIFPEKIKLFTNVTQGVVIVGFNKSNPANNHSFKIGIENNTQTLENPMFESIIQANIKKFYPNNFEFPLIKKGDMNILNKLKSVKSTLKEFITDSLQGNINTIHLARIKSENSTGIYLMKGENIQRYGFVGNFMNCIESDEILKFLDKNSQSNIIAMQGIHNIDAKFRIHCTLLESKNTNKFVFLHSTKILFVECKEIAKYLIGLLNSRLLNWLFKKTSTNNNINIYELQSLPIPKPNSKNQKLVDEIVNSVNQILEIKKENSQTDTTKIEKDIDNLIYKLYNLDANEIKIIERA